MSVTSQTNYLSTKQMADKPIGISALYLIPEDYRLQQNRVQKIISHILRILLGRDSSVDSATRYGLDDLGIESLWGRYFPHPSRPALCPTHPFL